MSLAFFRTARWVGLFVNALFVAVVVVSTVHRGMLTAPLVVVLALTSLPVWYSVWEVTWGWVDLSNPGMGCSLGVMQKTLEGRIKRTKWVVPIQTPARTKRE